MSNVIESTFKLMRALKRKGVQAGPQVPPTVGKILSFLKENDGASSSELCELVDIRPSSMSELLTKMEAHQHIERKVSKADKRITQVFLTEQGKQLVDQVAERRVNFENEFSSCFNDDEKEQFCLLADKLAAHLEATAGGKEGCMSCRGHGPENHFGHHGPRRFHHCR